MDVQPGHSYYVSIRTVDQEGNLANFYRWVGPFPIRLPEPPDMAATTPGSEKTIRATFTATTFVYDDQAAASTEGQ